MKEIACNGLDGANPLHLLATLGLFRLISFDDQNVKLMWTEDIPFMPMFHTTMTLNDCQKCIVRYLGIRGVVALNFRLEKAKKARDENQALINGLTGKDRKSNSTRKILQEGLKKEKYRIKRIEKNIGKSKRHFLVNNLLKKHPLTSLADSIHKISQDELRNLINSQGSLMWDKIVPGLTADLEHSYKKGEINILRSRLSFSNGGSGKAILKDWLANLSLLRRSFPEEGNIMGIALQKEKITGLMWDPEEMRDHALRWTDPNDEDTYSIPVLNVLAFVGLSFFTVLPSLSARGEETVAISKDGKSFVWPLWSPPLSVKVVESLIASSSICKDEIKDNYYKGISSVFRSKIISANKRNFFTRAEPV